jgi:hypothetical protein
MNKAKMRKFLLAIALVIAGHAKAAGLPTGWVCIEDQFAAIDYDESAKAWVATTSHLGKPFGHVIRHTNARIDTLGSDPTNSVWSVQRGGWLNSDSPISGKSA